MKKLRWKEPSLFALIRADHPPASYWFFEYGRAFATWFLTTHFLLTFGQWLSYRRINYGLSIIFISSGFGVVGAMLKLLLATSNRKIYITDKGIMITDVNGITQIGYEVIQKCKIVRGSSPIATNGIFEIEMQNGTSVGIIIPARISMDELKSALTDKVSLEIVEST